MPAFEGGPAQPITTGGSSGTPVGPAQPVYVASGGPRIAGRARRVIAVTSGPVLGGPAIPVYDAGVGALYTDEPPIPVYVVSGSIGSGGGPTNGILAESGSFLQAESGSYLIQE